MRDGTGASQRPESSQKWNKKVTGVHWCSYIRACFLIYGRFLNEILYKTNTLSPTVERRPNPPEKVNLSLWKLKNVFLILLTFEAGLSLEFFFQILLESFFMTKPHSFLIAQTTQV